MPDLLKTKLSEKPVAANLLPGDRLVVLRRAQDEADASKRNLTVGLAALQAWLALASGAGALRLTLAQAQALEGEGVSEQLYLLTGTPTEAGQTLGTWNASGTSAAVYVPGYAGYFGREGVLLDVDGQPVARVSVDVAAGTYTLIPDLAPTVAEHAQQLATLEQRALTAIQRARLSPITLALASSGFLGYTTFSNLLAANQYTDGAITLNEPANAEGLELSGDIAVLRGQGNALFANTGRILLGAGRVSEVQLINVDIASRALFDCRLTEGIRIVAGYTVTATDCQIRGDATTVAGTLVLGPGTTVDGEFILEPGGQVLDQRGGGTGSGTVKTVNGVAPDAAGEVTLASRDVYDVPASKRMDVADAIINQVAAGGQAMLRELDADYVGQVFKDNRIAGDPYRYTCDKEANASTGATEYWWNRTRIR